MYSLYRDDKRKILNTLMLFYHFPILATFVISSIAGLNLCEWIMIGIYLFVAFLIYPINTKSRESGYLKKLYKQQVEKKQVNRISTAFLIGATELSHVIFTIMTIIVFLTLAFYMAEKPHGTVNSLVGSIEYTFYAIDIKGFNPLIVHTTCGKIISVLLWIIGLFIPAILIGFWLQAFQKDRKSVV